MKLGDRIRKLMEVQIVIEYSKDKDTASQEIKDLIKERNELIRDFPRFLD